jgi:ABC-type nitrate/sulfonate/bicarbonate transport system permease component
MAVAQHDQPAGTGSPLAQTEYPAGPSRRKKKLVTANRLIGAAAVVAVMGLWQLVVDTHLVGSFLLASPSSVFAALYNLFTQQDFLSQIRVTAYQFILGYLMAVVVGVSVGLLMGWFDRVQAALQPIVSALYSTPHVALIPLFVVWFGVGDQSKIVMVFVSATFPILINTLAGVETADRELLQMAHAFGASRTQLFRTVLLPAAVPFIMTGLRLAVGVGVVLVIVGEMLAGTDGVGYVIQNAGQTFQIADIFAGVLVVAVGSTILMALLRRLEHRFDAWRPAR